MSRVARTIYVFGAYLVVAGAVLVVAPNALLSVLRVPPTTEPWIRVLGVVVLVLGAYYMAAARHELLALFQATIWGRATTLIAFTALVVLRIAPGVLLIFGIIDGAGALWTALALRDRAGAA